MNLFFIESLYIFTWVFFNAALFVFFSYKEEVLNPHKKDLTELPRNV